MLTYLDTKREDLYFFHVILYLGGGHMEWLKKISQSIYYIESNLDGVISYGNLTRRLSKN